MGGRIVWRQRTPGSVDGVSPDSAPLPVLPVTMLHDRLLVLPEVDSAERQSSAGLVIPATAVGPKRLGWAKVAAAGENVRQVSVGDRILFDPEDKAEVEISGTHYVLLREKDVHAVSQVAETGEKPGLYL